MRYDQQNRLKYPDITRIYDKVLNYLVCDIISKDQNRKNYIKIKSEEKEHSRPAEHIPNWKFNREDQHGPDVHSQDMNTNNNQNKYDKYTNIGILGAWDPRRCLRIFTLATLADFLWYLKNI